jgi:hypothetical protein
VNPYVNPIVPYVPVVFKRIHTQDSWYLEQDKSYDREKLVHFFKMWNVRSVG